MWNMLWPAGLIVFSNTIYHIVAKSTPEKANPFLSLVVTYLVAAGMSLIMYFLFSGKNSELTVDFGQLSWTSVVLGLVIIGLEAGYIYLYRAGWQINVASLTLNVCLACILLVVGFVLYKETLTIKQIMGILLCVGGLILINIK